MEKLDQERGVFFLQYLIQNNPEMNKSFLSGDQCRSLEYKIRNSLFNFNI